MSWLSAIARNHAIDQLRARKPVANTIDEAYDLADSASDPEKSAIDKAEGRKIDKSMAELDADRTDAVSKGYVEGLSCQELAGLFGVPLNMRRTWLRRSLSN